MTNNKFQIITNDQASNSKDRGALFGILELELMNFFPCSMRSIATGFVIWFLLFGISFGLSGITFFPQVNAQSPVDSLEKAFQSVKSDSVKLDILYNLSWALRGTDPQKAMKYAQEGCRIQVNSSNIMIYSKILNTAGVIHYILGNYDSSILYHNRCIVISDSLGYKRGVAGAMYNLASVYGEKGNLVKSQDYLLKAVKIFEDIPDTLGIAGSYMNIGVNYFAQKKTDKALEYFLKTSSFLEILKDDYVLGVVSMNIGSIYANKHELDSALAYFYKGLTCHKKVNYERGVASCHENIGSIYINLKHYIQAEDHISKALEFYQKSGMQEGICTASNFLGENALALHNPAKAKLYFLAAAAIADSTGNYYRAVDIYHNLAKTAALLGDFHNAFNYSRKHAILKDTILTAESNKQLTEMQTIYETEKKEKENELLLKEKKLTQSEINRQRLIIFFIIAGLALLVVLALFIYRGFLLKKKANLDLERKNITIVNQKNEIEKQKSLIEEKNRNITDSIYYAQRIQEAILPPYELIKNVFPQSFILYKPKDIICGDFYFFAQVNQYLLFAVADCTGHGVPGALMSMIGNDLLHDIVNDRQVTTSAMVLDELDVKLTRLLNPEGKSADIKDGMDIAFCAYDISTGIFQYAGANRPLWVIQNQTLAEYKPDYQPIGETGYPKTKFKNCVLKPQSGDVVYLFTDGFADQIGGPKNSARGGSAFGGKKFMTRNLKELLVKIQPDDMVNQEKILNDTFEKWKGTGEQLDDVTVMGIKL